MPHEEVEQMIDFIFFDAGLRDQFLALVQRMDIPRVQKDDELGMVVSVAEELPDADLETLEEEYEALMEAQSRLADEGDSARSAVGIHFIRGDGKPCLLRLDPDLAGRLLASFSPEEIDALIAAILQSAENPNAGPLCKSQ
jgi:hypothetical protein